MDITRESDLLARLAPAVHVEDGTVRITNPAALRGEPIDALIHTAVFAEDGALKAKAYRLLHSLAHLSGAVSASILPLYEARGRSEVSGFTVPAFNIRVLTYDAARAVFRAARRTRAGAFIFELARSEIGYTFQRPAEYAGCVLAAAIAEGYAGPVFVQGDHYQANAKKFAADAAGEEAAIRELIEESLAAGYRNIDIDSSTLVDLSKKTVAEQQRVNGEVCARLTACVREREPRDMPVSVGGEIGEVGKQNSTPEELRAFMSEYRRALDKIRPGLEGISKISVQTGTSHGGIPLPDGSVARVKIDFDTLRELSAIGRREYALAGAVQHGASTLPEELFDRFPAVETAEIHLATGFQNMLYDHPRFPADLRAEMYAWLDANCADERKDGETAEQFHYKTRKKAWGPFKRQMWDLPADVRADLMRALEEQFVFLMEKLRVAGTADLVRRTVPVATPTPAAR